MGYMRHHAIIVAGCLSKPRSIKEAHAEAEELCRVDGHSLVSPIVEGVTNGYASFMVAPDGSKEGWDASECGDTARADFIAWLEKQRYDDNSSPYQWVLVQFGDDEHKTKIIDDSDALVRREGYKDA